MRRLWLATLAAAASALAQEPAPDPANFVPEAARVAAADGNAAFAKGDFEAARKAYRQVLDLAPGNQVALVNLGAVEFRAGQRDEAEKLLLRAVDAKRDNGPAWLTLGILYYEERSLDKAFAALAQAVLYDKANARAHNYLGAVLGAKEWLDGAAAELREAVRIDPAYRDAHYNLALIYLQQRPPAIELARRHYYRSTELGGPRDAAIEKQLNPAP